MTVVARNASQPPTGDSQMFAAGPDAARTRFLELAGSATDGRASLTRLAAAAVPALADWCAIELGHGLDQIAVRVPEHRSGGEPLPLRRGLARAAHRRVRVLASGGESAIIAPLRARAELLGAIAFGFSGENAEIPPERLEFARTAAERLSTAISARLPAPSLEPRPHDGLDVASCSRIAGGGSAGGDFHDLIEVDGGLVIAIGDVCGKGGPAAAPSARVRRTLRSLLEGRGPHDLPLGELNTAVAELGGGAPFCTLALMSLERRAGGGFHAVVARAGHPHPLLVRRGRGHLVGSTGDLLGVFDDARFTTERLDLLPGDTVVLYTDGLTDLRAPEEILDVTSLAPVVASMNGGDAAARLRAIEDAADVRGRALRDDLSVIVARVTG